LRDVAEPILANSLLRFRGGFGEADGAIGGVVVAELFGTALAAGKPARRFGVESEIAP